jgi:hypothetical protein
LRVILLLVAVFAFMPRIAAADKTVGVLVTGDFLKAPTVNQAEKWLRGHGQRVVTTPMPTDAVKILLDCFVLDDSKCMRSVVEARATTENLVSIRVDVASKKSREVRLTMDWFAKGHNPISSRRTCDACTEPVLRTLIDAMLDDLAKTAPGFTGRIKITSDPAGITVLLDNAAIGVTPIERDVPAGEHKVRLVRDGRTGEEKTVKIESGTVAELELEVPAVATQPADPIVQPAPARRSRLVPGLMIGIGVAGVGAGAALYLTSEEPTGQGRTYRDTKNLGIGVAAGGGALLLTGVIIILATGSSSAPTVALTPGGATVGWAGRF